MRDGEQVNGGGGDIRRGGERKGGMSWEQVRGREYAGGCRAEERGHEW